MHSLSQVGRIHLEPTTACNAACPLCVRNVAGYEHNDGYPDVHMTLENLKKILSQEFLTQISEIYISGNFGDFVMNPESLDILEYLRNSTGENCWIEIGTNGGARDQYFWKQAAKLSSGITFCIDGLEDTHSLYRLNTMFSTVLKNAKTVIEAGGKASWKFIVFDHNRHQIEQAKQLSKDLGFAQFSLHDHGRSQGPVSDRKGNVIRWIGEPLSDLPHSINGVLQHPLRLQPPSPDKWAHPPSSSINCWSINNKEIYITAAGDVYPCCFMGHYPETYHRDFNTMPGNINHQLRDLAKNNNAIVHGLESAMQWFDSIESKWQKKTYSDGRLIVCDSMCGVGSKMGNHSNTEWHPE